MIDKKNIAAKFILQRIKELLEEGDLKKAEVYAESIKRLSAVMYHIALSYIAESNGDMKKAVEETDTAYAAALNVDGETEVSTYISGNPVVIVNNRTVLERYADLIYRTERFGEALFMYDILYTLYPENEEYLRRFILSALKKRRTRMAKNFIAELLKKQSSIDFDTLIQYTDALKANKEIKYAEEVLEAVIDTVEDANVAYELGSLYVEDGDVPQREKVIKVINILDKSIDPDDIAMKGFLFNKINMPKNAVVQFVRGARIAYLLNNETDPNNLFAQQLFATAIETALNIQDSDTAKSILNTARALIPEFKERYEKELKQRFGTKWL